MKVHFFTDSELTLESIASSKQIERKSLRMTIRDMKDCLLDGEVESYQWISTNDIWADGLTKENELLVSFEEVLLDRKLVMRNNGINKVQSQDGEIRMASI